MIAINLINWRAQRTLILNRRFAVVISAAIVATLILALFISLIISGQIGTAQDGLKYLDTQLAQVAGTIAEIKDIQAKKDSLLSRRTTIELLQASRPLDVEIFDNLARIVPTGVVLTQVVRKGESIIISGDSDSNYNVSVLMENAQRLEWVKLAKLGQLKTVDGGSSGRAVANAGKVNFEVNLTMATQDSGVQNATQGN